MRGSKGSPIPSTPTVSRCPQRSSVRPPPLPRARTMTLGRPGVPSRRSTSRPASRPQPATKSAASPSPAAPGSSDGLTESIATSARVSSTTSVAPMRCGRYGVGRRGARRGVARSVRCVLLGSVCGRRRLGRGGTGRGGEPEARCSSQQTRPGVVTRHQVGNVQHANVGRGPRPYGIAVSEIARAITRRWISEVPSKIV